ncbi:MAG: hypothetical protein ACK5N9_23430, partial [Pirellula sp.]
MASAKARKRNRDTFINFWFFRQNDHEERDDNTGMLWRGWNAVGKPRGDLKIVCLGWLNGSCTILPSYRKP